LSRSNSIKRNWPLPPSFEQSRAIVAGWARFHAGWWDDARLGVSVGAWIEYGEPRAAALADAVERFAALLAGCGKSRDFGKTVMKRARNRSPGLIKSTGYEGAKGDESGWKHHRPTFSAAC
jgi:hypothetical protein